MKVIFRHLTIGLFYLRSFRIIPSLIGTIIPFFWQMVNLYGVLPALFIIVVALQLLITSLAAVLYSCLLFQIGFIKAYYASVLFILGALISWLFINFSINQKAKFRLIKLQFSTRLSLLLLGILLGNRLMPLTISPQTTFWDVHLKPHIAGKLTAKKRGEIITALQHDIRQAHNLMKDAVFFGCSPGSFKKLLLAAGLQESQFTMMKTIIPKKSARIFGAERTFYFYVIDFNGIPM